MTSEAADAGGWRLRIRHRTGFKYAGPVRTSYNEARLTPLSFLGQTTLDSRVEVSPAATSWRYWDYWGTQVTAFDVHEEHDLLEVTGTSVVETSAGGVRAATVGWSELLDETYAPVASRRSSRHRSPPWTRSCSRRRGRSSTRPTR